MKPLRNILILVLVVALLGGGLYFVMQYEPAVEDNTPELPDTITLFKIEKNSIKEVCVTNENETYTLSDGGGKWLVNGDPSIKVSVSRVDTLLYECANVVVQNMVAENVEDLSIYGLDHPRAQVCILQNDGSETTILIGHESLQGSVSYIMLAGDDKVYVKSTSGCKNLTSPLSELADNDIYSMNAEALGGFYIKRKNAEPIRIELVQKNSDSEEPAYQWEMFEPIKKVANDYTINEKLLTNILVQSAVTAIPIPETGKDYGLDNPQASYGIWNREKTEAINVKVGHSEGENTYISLEDDASVYLVATEKLDFLQLGYLDLVDKLVHIENINDVSEVQISGLGKEFTLSISGSGEEMTYSINGKPMEESKFKKTYQAILNLTLSDYITEKKSGSPEFTISYKKHDGNVTRMQCISYDDRNYLVTVNGEGNLLVRKKQIDTMIQAIESALSE